MTHPALEVSHVSKTYANRIRALTDISFAVRHGEIFGLLGGNGAGKSTLLKIMSTLVRPTSGTVRVLGMDALEQPTRIREMLGVVSQDINLDPHLSVHQNLSFHCRYFGIDRKAAQKRIAEWLDLLELDGHADRPIHGLSGGTKRKVMIARALLTNPALLVLDEPSNGLDPVVRAAVWEKILAFKRSGGTVLLSTHQFEEAQRLCDRVGILRQGEILPHEGVLAELEAGFRAVSGL